VARNKTEVHKALFAVLDAHCAAAQDPVSNAGVGRWVDTSGDPNLSFMTRAKLSESWSFSASRYLARYDLDGRSYFCAIGFDYISAAPTGFSKWYPSSSEQTYILSTLKPRPKASTLAIRTIVESADITTPHYKGFSPNSIFNLFPSISIFDAPTVTHDENWRVFFHICVKDCNENDSWIDGPLSASLEILSAAGINEIPFRMLCRSVLDSDPTSMFMSLYRCLEFIFSYGPISGLINALSLSVSWSDMLKELESRSSWRSKEDKSLAELFKAADIALVAKLAKQLSVDISKTPDEIAESTAGKIYDLRNNIVHYRPAHKDAQLSKHNWNRICEYLSDVVLNVYQKSFP
tara:strand:- start:202 stop:1248 length:1047 start_codon:yes stop_codon:yes gene_type:complete